MTKSSAALDREERAALLSKLRTTLRSHEIDKATVSSGQAHELADFLIDLLHVSRLSNGADEHEEMGKLCWELGVALTWRRR